MRVESREQQGQPSLLCILASVLQFLPLRATDLFALQELTSYHFPIQRVWMMLHFLLELLDVLRKRLLCRKMFLDTTSFV